MKRKKPFPVSCFLAVLLTAFTFVCLIVVIIIPYFHKVQNARINANTPPVVIVHAPGNGELIQVGDAMIAYVTGVGNNPITRLEFWLDGVLVDIKTPNEVLGAATAFAASTELRMNVGLHIFSARAVDNKGLIGQSLPIAIQSRSGVIEIIAEDGQTLQDIADANGIDENLLKNINPNFGDGLLPKGAGVIAPAPGNGIPPNGGKPGELGPIINPPNPIPIPPAGINMLQIAGPVIDIGSLVPLLFAAVPKAPTPLQAGYGNCSIRLMWMDNADNESYFHVWMQALGGPPKVIATLTGSPKTGPAWYEFDAPWVGIYSFWIEAVNTMGRQSSEIVWVGINDLGCKPGVATHLDIEIQYMFVGGAYDRVYCYLSIEGAPEKRIPVDDNQFVPVLNSWGDVSNWTGNGNSLLLPEPQDNEVAFEGKCLGWQGGSGPDNLGTFTAHAPRETWDGRRMELTGAGFTIGYRVQPHGPGAANGIFTYVDYSLPLPFKPWITVKTSKDHLENDKLARQPKLHWNWIGDQSKLSGFTLIMDGKPIKTVPNTYIVKATTWEQTVTLPTSCGGDYIFEVAANSGEAMSALSMPFNYVQTPCQTYAEVKFETIKFGCLFDGDVPVIQFVAMDCEGSTFGANDTIEPYYWIAVNGEMKNISSKDMTINIEYSFHELGLASPQKYKYSSYNTFLVPIDPQNPAVWFGLTMKDADPWYDADDHICGFNKDLSMPYSVWGTYDNVFEMECDSWDAHGLVKVRVRGIQSLDAWRSANPGIGQPIGP